MADQSGAGPRLEQLLLQFITRLNLLLPSNRERMIEAINDLERDLAIPVINSNQATIWACLKKMGIPHSDNRLGRLFSLN